MKKDITRIILENFILKFGDRILKTSFIKDIKYWRSIQYSSRKSLDTMQYENLKKLLKYSVENVAFYQNKSIKLTREPYKDIKKFPIIDKSILKEHIDNFIVGDKRKLLKNVSSGSSGVQISVYENNYEKSYVRALQTMLWEWAGYYIGSKFIQLGMTSKRGFVKACKDLLLNTTYTLAYDLDENIVTKLLYRCRKQKNVFFGGYASGLYTFAHIAKKYEIKDVKFKSVISWGDKLFPHYRKLIKEQFDSDVYDVYGCSEGIIISGQCEKFNNHIITPHVFVELLDDNNNEVEPGEIGNVIVTRLDNFSMPLIRYRVGDLAIKEDPNKLCTCGRSFPLLKKIIGRETDIVYTKNNKSLIVHFFTGIFEYYPQIMQFMIVQDKIGVIEVKYIKDKGFEPNILMKIQEDIINKAKDNIEILFTNVNEIAPTKSGKPQIVISNLKKKLFK